MTHPTTTTYNIGYSQLTKTEGVTLMGGGVFSDNQGVITRKNNKGCDTEAAGFSGNRHAHSNTNITI